ncbi:hypothetical protein F383_29253 [Gossypium arboreum]|uniref:Uncharacterized protein n=2 Tax=Gossypium arboreum TaxID=29729 RepID=A0A0B0PH22_GOSAR|nr:hypothetical protein PVK06_007792 [Gossypium arboreum]KHG19851.1 hypothetical protein F383_09782 [Gossypium arboreum]KHG22681.1 hypothetical protein F383_29253 [Gossypium arboreum]
MEKTRDLIDAFMKTRPYEGARRRARRRAKEAVRGATRGNPTLWPIPEASGALICCTPFWVYWASCLGY